MLNHAIIKPNFPVGYKVFDPRKSSFQDIREVQTITSGKYRSPGIDLTAIFSNSTNSVEQNINKILNLTNAFDFVSETKKIIESYREYSCGWDGANALPPSKNMIYDAMRFIDEMRNDIEMPQPMLAVDGEISFYWGRRESHMDVIFTGNGTYSYFAQNEQGKKYYMDDKPVDKIDDLFYEILLKL